MAIEIRSALPGDAPSLREIYLATRLKNFTWLETGAYRMDDFDRDTEGEVVIVAVDEGKAAGFISLWLPDNFVHHLFVHPLHAGKGIGRSLLEHGLKRIGRPATLKCLSLNVRAVKFYADNGWKVREAGSGPDGPYCLFEHT